jgi:hypothetical protein
VGAAQDVDLDVEMQLAHALDDRLARLLVGADVERRVLVGELVERHRHLLLVGLGLGLDRHLDDRLGELHHLQDDRLGHVAQRVAGAHVLDADQGDDVAGIGLGDFHPRIGMHQHHAADAVGLAAGRVQHRLALLTLPE